MYDPIQKAEEIKKLVVRGTSRKYYRIARGGKWYGGIATCDCVGCNLDCVFCWSNYPRKNPNRSGKFYTPDEIHRALLSCARKQGYQSLRISGNEITISPEHLFELLRKVANTPYTFILETNGTLIDDEIARELSRFQNIYVRVSFKGTNPWEFSKLTGAIPEGFYLQLRALESLVKYKVPCWASVVVSFSTPENIVNFTNTIKDINQNLPKTLEQEVIFILPHIEKRLKEKGIKPKIFDNTIFKNRR